MGASFRTTSLFAAKPKGEEPERDTDYGGRTLRRSGDSKPAKPENDTGTYLVANPLKILNCKLTLLRLWQLNIGHTA
ncbi:hypothetical protein EG329_003787 [Mollisiaceae sp. DMI_Dod_QoI]|nr:hypothetical protein EG329_003787 [Helotiales sp. DMI_Dod_QoI]